MKKFRPAVLFGVAFLISGSLAWASEPLRVLTWNVGLLRVVGYDIVPEVGRRLEKIPGQLAALSEQRSLDLIGLQEVWEESQAQAIEKALVPLGYRVFRPKVASWLGLSSGLLLAVKGSLSVDSWSFERLEANLGWEGWAAKGLLRASLTTETGESFDVVLFHLGAVGLNNGLPVDPSQVSVYTRQTQQLSSLVGRIDGRVLVLGDANTGPDEGQELFDNLKSLAGLVEIGPLPLITWDPSNSLVARGVFPSDPASMIDHIFLKGEGWGAGSFSTLEVMRGESGGDLLSDHYGLLATIEPSAEEEPAQATGGEPKSGDDHHSEIGDVTEQ